MHAVIPSAVFVLGKGGVGRSTVATALAAGFAARGERVLIMQWAVADAISPWFGLRPTGFVPQRLAANLTTRNYSMDEAFEDYFVAHLHARTFYKTVIANRHVRRAMNAAPGLAELMFLGNVMAVTSIEHSCDRVIVDTPAMGHGASLLAMPQVTRTLGFGGLLAVEAERVTAMLADPARATAVVVTTPDELAVEETLEFWPSIERDLGRAPLAAIVNSSSAPLGELPEDPRACAWFSALGGPPALAVIYAHHARRAGREAELARRLDAPVLSIADARLLVDDPTPRAVVAHATAALQPLWGPA